MSDFLFRKRRFMRRIKHYNVEVMEYEYTFDEKQELLDWLEQKYGMNYSIKRAGPKMIEPGRCHENLHHMIIYIRK